MKFKTIQLRQSSSYRFMKAYGFSYSIIIILSFLSCSTSKDTGEIIRENHKNQLDSLKLVIQELKEKEKDKPFKLEAGKCYASCYIMPSYETTTNYYNVYTGENYNRKGIETKIIQNTEEKININKELKNLYKEEGKEDIDDCVYFCYEIEKHFTFDTIYVVLDTLRIKEFEIKAISQKELIQEGFWMDWREMIPGSGGLVNKTMIRKIQKALIKLGYNLEITNKLDSMTKQCLIEYQKKNNLNVGKLDYETLKSLKIH